MYLSNAQDQYIEFSTALSPSAALFGGGSANRGSMQVGGREGRNSGSKMIAVHVLSPITAPLCLSLKSRATSRTTG